MTAQEILEEIKPLGSDSYKQLCASSDRHRHPKRRGDRPGNGRFGRQRLSSALCPRLYPQGSGARHCRQEAQNGEMLNG